MKSSFSTTGLMSVLLCGVVALQVSGAPPKSTGVKPGVRGLLKMEQEYVATLGGDDSPLKSGMKVDIYLQAGKKFDQVEITDLLPGKEKNSLKVIACKSTKGAKQKIQANTLLHIATENNGFDIVQDPSTKAFLALDLARRDELTKKRLEKQGHQLWQDSSDAERKDAIEDAKKLFEKAKELFPDHQFQLEETEFFLFFTDMPANQIAGYVSSLDAMYRQLCVAFGVRPGKNIWKGKCPILAFLERDDFQKFEMSAMNNPDTKRAQGLHHGMSDGRVVVTVYRGNSPAYFATILVHETAHGFVHRLRSIVHITGWLNEGIADWIAGVAVPANDAVSRRQTSAIAQMRSSSSMGGFFDPEKTFDATDYGIASSLTQFMLQSDSNLYRAFLMGIKDGYSIEESLKLTYNCTPADLVQSFGESIGVPDLRP